MGYILLHATHFITPILQKHGLSLISLVVLHRLGVFRAIWNIGHTIFGFLYLGFACMFFGYKVAKAIWLRIKYRKVNVRVVNNMRNY